MWRHIFPLCWNRSRQPVSCPVFLLSMKIQDFTMILIAMFDSSVLEVGAEFTSWQASDEGSRVLKKSGITGVYEDYFRYWRFSPKKVDEFIGEINCRRAGREKLICFPGKKTSNCAKRGFAVTFSWIDKARVLARIEIHFLFENGVL